MASTERPDLSTDAALTAARWDDEYRKGRYAAAPPLPFVAEILHHLRQRRHLLEGRGLYVGCGSGRNFLPLLDAGLDLCGLDVSPEALRRLAGERPAIAGRLICEDFRRYRARRSFAYLIAIQVFQHGTVSDAATYFRRSAELLRPGGLLFVRVNSVSTEIYRRHSVIERTVPGGLTVRYEDGPKQGMAIHFFSRDELQELTRRAFRAVVEPREDLIERVPPQAGRWAQWEMTWEKR